jgi:hypothetical protein
MKNLEIRLKIRMAPREVFFNGIKNTAAGEMSPEEAIDKYPAPHK